MLLIIQGGYRTLDLTVDSIIRNLCLVNADGCDVALSMSSYRWAMSTDTRIKLAPHLVAEWYREPGIQEQQQPYAIFEYDQTLKVFRRALDIAERYEYVLRVRADCYISVPMPMLSAIGQGAHFARDWKAFASHSHASDARARIRDWLFAGGIPSLVPKLRQPSPMAWSPLTAFEFNEALLRDIAALPDMSDDDIETMRRVIQDLVAKHHLIYMSGGLFMHFGPPRAIHSITQCARDHWQQGPATNPLTWQRYFAGHPKVTAWKKPISQEANIRLTHRHLGYALIDLNNWADYLVSFSWKYYGYAQLTSARGLMCWLLRERQVRFRMVAPAIAPRFWDPIDNCSYPTPDLDPSARPIIVTHGCLAESSPAETDQCFQAEESL